MSEFELKAMQVQDCSLLTGNDLQSKCHKFHNCILCPKNAICTNGDIKCNFDYKQEGKACVEDNEVRDKALRLLNEYAHYLKWQKGLYDCGQEEQDWRSVLQMHKDLEDSLSKEPYSERQAVMAKIVSLENEGTLFKELGIMNRTVSGMDVYYSDEAIHSFLCGLKLWVYDYAVFIILFFTVAGFLG